jgi:type I restriction enzyme S subunit
LHYLHSKRFRRAAPITTNMAHLTLERLIPIEFPVPPRDEQRAIVDRYEQMRDMRNELGAAIRDRERSALWQSVLKAAFEGRLVPQEPTDAPACALLARLREGNVARHVTPARRRRSRDAAQGALTL